MRLQHKHICYRLKMGKIISALSNVFTFYHPLFYVLTPLIHELFEIRPILRHFYCFDNIVLIQSISLQDYFIKSLRHKLYF